MDLIDKINKIKYLRMEPEIRFILDIINQVKPYCHTNGNKILKYKIDNKLIFSYNKLNENLWFDYSIYHEMIRYKNEKELYNIVKKYFKKYLYNGEINFVNYGSPRIKKDKNGFNQFI